MSGKNEYLIHSTNINLCSYCDLPAVEICNKVQDACICGCTFCGFFPSWEGCNKNFCNFHSANVSNTYWPLWICRECTDSHKKWQKKGICNCMIFFLVIFLIAGLIGFFLIKKFA